MSFKALLAVEFGSRNGMFAEMSPITKERIRLHSGVEAIVVTLHVTQFHVEPFNDAPPSELASRTEAGLTRARLAVDTYPVAHPAVRSTATESIHGADGSEIQLWADRAVSMVAAYKKAGLAPAEIWSDRRGAEASRVPAPIAHTDLLRLRSATLAHDEVFANANYFLFEPREVDTPYEAYGDPVAMVVADGVVLYPPQMRRACLVSYGQRVSIEKIGFDDVILTLPGNVVVKSHPQGRFDRQRAAGAPIALARYFGALERSTPAEGGVCEIAILGRHAVALGQGGGLPIPRGGCVLRFPHAPEPGLIAALRAGEPIRYELRQGALREGVQTGPLLVTGGRVSDDIAVFSEEGMLTLVADEGRMQPSPFNWKADWHHTRAARLAAGIDERGGLFFVAVEGKSTYAKRGAPPRGATLFDLAELLRERGAVEAMHLDGGGSTQIFRPFGGAILRPGNFCKGFEDLEVDYDRPLPLGLRLQLRNRAGGLR